jgi:geranylgeranyl diphosphate synthase type II
MSEPGPSNDVAEMLRERGMQLERALKAVLARQGDAPPRLDESLRYSLLAGGKRLRPTLVLEWHAAVSASAEPSISALAAAVAIELIHTFSLVHDDLPAMDDDDLRRGRPTNHRVFGEAMAILAGDAMTAMAFETIATDADARHVPSLIAELARATGPGGMIGGQVLDIENENVALDLAQLQRLHAMKTGMLLTCACRLGAIAADASTAQLAAAEAYGRHVGLAFQIMDDVLDETSTAEQMGKATRKDHGAGKNTYPRMLGLEGSIERARREVAAAQDALAGLGDGGARLASIARFITERRH